MAGSELAAAAHAYLAEVGHGHSEVLTGQRAVSDASESHYGIWTRAAICSVRCSTAQGTAVVPTLQVASQCRSGLPAA